MATQSVETASGPRRLLAETGGARALKGNYYERHIWSTLFYTNTNVCTKQLESKKGKHMQIYSNLRQKSTFESGTTHTLHAITQKHTPKSRSAKPFASTQPILRSVNPDRIPGTKCGFSESGPSKGTASFITRGSSWNLTLCPMPIAKRNL